MGSRSSCCMARRARALTGKGTRARMRMSERARSCTTAPATAAPIASVAGGWWTASPTFHRSQTASVSSGSHQAIRQMLTEAFRNGVWGYVDDALCLIQPWGFDVTEIRVPTRVVYGLTDVLVPR